MARLIQPHGERGAIPFLFLLFGPCPCNRPGTRLRHCPPSEQGHPLTAGRLSPPQKAGASRAAQETCDSGVLIPGCLVYHAAQLAKERGQSSTPLRPFGCARIGLVASNGDESEAIAIAWLFCVNNGNRMLQAHAWASFCLVLGSQCHSARGYPSLSDTPFSLFWIFK